MIEGTIIRGVGGFYYVDTCRGIVQCRARGKMRREKITPMVGDKVKITMASENPPEGAVDEILPRRNYLIRPPVANIDTVVIVISTSSPAPDFSVIDKLTASAEHAGINVVIAVNKTDICPEDLIVKTYAPTGYKIIPVSAATGGGIDELKKAIAGQMVAFAGNSGVGKSSILNYFGFDLPVGEVSKIERGKHTTRHVELMPMENGGFVMDTPGFSLLELNNISVESLKDLFAEFKDYSKDCRFKDCRHFHTSPGDCGVAKAVAEGRIARSRYDSYCELFDKLKDVKEWEIRGD